MQIPTNAMGIMFVRIDKGDSAKDNMGDWLVQQRIAQSISIVTEVVHKYGGIVGKTFESAMLSTFPKADKASRAACEIQQALFADNSESTVSQTPMEIRISLNYGKMMVAAGNVAGPEIDIVVQLGSNASAEQILATDSFVKALSRDEKKNSRSLGKSKPSGMQAELELHEILWTERDLTVQPSVKQQPKPAPAPAPEPAPVAEPEAAEVEEALDETAGIEIPVEEPPVEEPPRAAEDAVEDVTAEAADCLEITYKNQQFMLGADKTSVSIGRKKENDIVIDQAYVSRSHAVIEYSAEGFVLKIMGANGARVFIGQANLGERCRDQMPLSGNGKITLGPPLEEAIDEIIYFKPG